ncbi:MAG TPA: DUF5412 family protein [Clostridia bacterium]|nr:DUF5412 family protein [Clostridia bacterium]
MRFFVPIFTAFFLAGCTDPCSNTTKAEATSPDAKYVATAFIKDCGATTGFSPQVHLRPVGERVALTGNVFTGDHSDKIEIAWLSATQLVIYSDCTVVRHETNYHGITIEQRDSR